jgi:hypothetical protein
MGWCVGRNTAAGKRYRRRVVTAMSVYVIVLLSCMKLVRAVSLHGWALYTAALLPAIPVMATLLIMGRYLQEETDEYLRMLTVRSLLVAAGAMLATSVVNDFLRVIAGAGALTPFIYFIVFFACFGIAQAIQERASLRGSDE